MCYLILGILPSAGVFCFGIMLNGTRPKFQHGRFLQKGNY